MKRLTGKRVLSVLGCLVLAFGLCACGRRAEVRPVDAPPATVTPDPFAAPAPTPPSLDMQKTILKNQQGLWAFESAPDPWSYAFTDLDHNGRLEVLAARTQGTGIYTTAHLWELGEDGSSVRNCLHGSSDDWPEITVTSLPGIYDRGADRWYYICENLTRDGVAHQYLSINALCLKDGAASWELLATKEAVWDANGSVTVTCKDAQGAPISEQDYANAPVKRFAGMESTTIPLDWTLVESSSSAPQPGNSARPGYVQEAKPATSVSAPVITKNPTSETLAAGEKTWFIAHASNADRITWEFMSPEGAAYDLNQAMQLHPGLKLTVLPEDTVEVDKVPASANGWGMRARFDGPGGSVVSSTAYLTVKDYARAYGGIIANYRAAYESGSYLSGEYMRQHGMSEMAAYSGGVGYALEDLDGNGLPELIVAGIGTQESARGVVYGVYTLVNEVPIELAVSQARNRYYLLSDLRLLNEGSSGASSTSLTALRVQGDMTVEEEIVASEPRMDSSTVDYYFQYGYGGEITSLTQDEFYQAMSMMESGVYVPELTRIY